jgi:hypothetical protein
MNTNFKVGDKILVSPYLTHKQDWEEGIIIEVEYNTIFNGFVLSVEMSDGDVFFQRATPDYFQPLNSK